MNLFGLIIFLLFKTVLTLKAYFIIIFTCNLVQCLYLYLTVTDTKSLNPFSSQLLGLEVILYCSHSNVLKVRVFEAVVSKFSYSKQEFKNQQNLEQYLLIVTTLTTTSFIAAIVQTSSCGNFFKEALIRSSVMFVYRLCISICYEFIGFK